MNLKMNLTFWFHNSAKRSDPIPWRSESILSFCRFNSLCDILVRAKHHRPPPKKKAPVAFRCNRSRWKTCPFITEGTTSYTFYSTNENNASYTTFPVHLPISFTWSSAINVLNMQYIGETKRQLSDRFEEQRRSIEKARNPHQFNHPTAVSDHFSLPDRSIKDIEIIPLELN